MPNNILRRSLDMLLRRQTNILSAAYIIMLTVLLSQVFGVVRKRLLISLFGASNDLGVYEIATKLPDFLFQIIIGAALSSAFIPVFSEFLGKNDEKTAHKMASVVLSIGLLFFLLISLILSLFAPFFLQLFNPGSGFSPDQMTLMANLMRFVIFGQVLFILGMFFTALLQSYNHFFIPGIAAAMYNVGIIIGILTLSSSVGVYAAAYGIIFGALIYVLIQIPLIKHVGFSFKPDLSLNTPGVKTLLKLMWPRTIAIAVMQVGTLVTVALVSFLPSSGRNFLLFDYAQTLGFAPIALIGQSIAQAAFPVLAREKNNILNFRNVFATSFTQMLYLILPISVFILILRIPIVRLIYGAQKLDWPATVLTGRILAFFALSIFAQALIALVSRTFYAMQNTLLPLIVSAISTLFMIILSVSFIMLYRSGIEQISFPYNFFGGAIQGDFLLSFGIEGIALSFSIASIINLFISLLILRRKIGRFPRDMFLFPIIKIFVASFLTAFALYIPIKLLDQLVFDTTLTINLIMLTGISSLIGLSLYLFLTWLFNVKEAKTYVQIIGRLGNWRDILGRSEEVIESTKL